MSTDTCSIPDLRHLSIKEKLVVETCDVTWLFQDSLKAHITCFLVLSVFSTSGRTSFCYRGAMGDQEGSLSARRGCWLALEAHGIQEWVCRKPAVAAACLLFYFHSSQLRVCPPYEKTINLYLYQQGLLDPSLHGIVISAKPIFSNQKSVLHSKFTSVIEISARKEHCHFSAMCMSPFAHPLIYSMQYFKRSDML